MNSKRLKVLFVLHLSPPVHGVSVMSDLIKGSNFINRQINARYINLTTAKNIDDLQKKRFLKYLDVIVILTRLKYNLLFYRNDIVYITLFPYGPAFIKDSLIVLLSKLFCKRVILHLHTYGFRKAGNRSLWIKKYYTKVFKNTEVICLSKLLLPDFSEFHTGKISILPNGIKKVNSVNCYKTSRGPFNLLYLSNLIKDKGLLLLLDAAVLLMQKSRSFTLRVVGSEFDLSYNMIEEYITTRGLEKHVKLLGPKYGYEKKEEFEQAEAFILPTNYDTIGLVLLEAMQYGIPCVATEINGIPDVLGDGRGILLKQLNPEAIADAIEFLMDHPEECLKMSRKCFDYFQNNYTSEIFEQRFINILTGNT